MPTIWWATRGQDTGSCAPHQRARSRRRSRTRASLRAGDWARRRRPAKTAWRRGTYAKGTITVKTRTQNTRDLRVFFSFAISQFSQPRACIACLEDWEVIVVGGDLVHHAVRFPLLELRGHELQRGPHVWLASRAGNVRMQGSVVRVLRCGLRRFDALPQTRANRRC